MSNASSYRGEPGTVQPLQARLCSWKQGVISTITPADRALYQHFFAHDHRHACYGNSFLYITQACRGFGLGLKYYDGDLLVSIGYYREHCVLVRPLGMLDQRIMAILNWLSVISGKPVFLKKLFPDQTAQVVQWGYFRDAVWHPASGSDARPGAYPWDAVAFADDDTYPELILDLDLTLNTLAPAATWYAQLTEARQDHIHAHQMTFLRKQFRSFHRSVRQFERTGYTCHICPYHADLAPAVHAFLMTYFHAAPQNVAAYDNLLGQGMTDPSHWPRWKYVAYLDGVPEPVGFLVFEQIDADAASGFAAVISRHYPGLSAYLYRALFIRLRQAGIRWVNLGGSETRSLHRFKRTFVPVEERVMPLLVYGVPDHGRTR